MPAPLVPIALAAGVIRMVAPTVARALIKSGMGRKATQAAINKAGKNIPRVTRNEAERIAKQANEAKKIKNLDRAQRLDKQPKDEKPYQTLSRAEKQEKAADSARTKLTPRQEAERLKRLNQQQNKQEKQNKQNKQNKQEQQSKQNKQEKPTPPSKPRIPNAAKGVAALTAAATGVGGVASLNKKKEQDKKLKPVPEVNVRTLPKPKKVRPAPKKGDNKELDIIPPKRKKTSKDKKADDGYRFYGKKGTGLGDFSRKYGMKYATQEQFEKDFDMSGGAKKGGSIKKLAKKKRKGFSGRGAGKALRGF